MTGGELEISAHFERDASLCLRCSFQEEILHESSRKLGAYDTETLHPFPADAAMGHVHREHEQYFVVFPFRSGELGKGNTNPQYAPVTSIGRTAIRSNERTIGPSL
jgi:hypothetical protein